MRACTRTAAPALYGDTHKRREVAPGVYQCGCHWTPDPRFGDVLVECAIHAQATRAAVARFDRRRKKKTPN